MFTSRTHSVRSVVRLFQHLLHGAASRGRVVLRLEVLEDRCVPAVDVRWTGGGNSLLWSNPRNWSTNQRPTVDSLVTIGLNVKTVDDISRLQIQALDCVNLQLNADLTVEAARDTPAKQPTLFIAGGTLDLGNHILTVDNQPKLSSICQIGANRPQVGDPSSTVVQGSLQRPGAINVAGGSLTLQGGLPAQAGQEASPSLTINQALILIARSNTATLNLSGVFQMSNGAAIRNMGGTMQAASNCTSVYVMKGEGAAESEIVNGRTFNVSNGVKNQSAQMRFDVPFKNATNAVTAINSKCQLTLWAGGYSNGSIRLQSGSGFTINTRTFAFNTGSSAAALADSTILIDKGAGHYLLEPS